MEKEKINLPPFAVSFKSIDACSLQLDEQHFIERLVWICATRFKGREFWMSGENLRKEFKFTRYRADAVVKKFVDDGVLTVRKKRAYNNKRSINHYLIDFNTLKAKLPDYYTDEGHRRKWQAFCDEVMALPPPGSKDKATIMEEFIADVRKGNRGLWCGFFLFTKSTNDL